MHALTRTLTKPARRLAGVAACCFLVSSASATIPYVDICGLASVDGEPTAGILVEAIRCSDDSVVVSALTDGDLENNYHLLHRDPDNGVPGGQFYNAFTPIEVYMRFTFADCPPVMVSCETVKAAYDATEDGKPKIDVNIDCPPPPDPGVECRVTGGTKHLTDKTFPPVNFVTHGGQVGAPVGMGTVFEPDTECIQGEWEHVRHGSKGYKANFHSKTYDSLLCACFGGGDSPGVVIGELCNPGNRDDGPEPRRAPSNKICFSGVGDISFDGGPRGYRTTLFRVDVEDRSEPGNGKKASEDPADRYRIRIWVLDEGELARLNTEGDGLMDFRKAIGCSDESTATTDGAPGALGSAAFGVRPPDIDDGGALDHGNQQIHPTIKDCK